jgi:FixJ family two-component response regulator
METLSNVIFVGDIQDVRECLESMITTGQLAIRRFASAGDALDYCEPQMPGCFVLDQVIRGTSGLRVQEQLHAKGCQQPFIYVLRNGDVASAVEAMHRGALDCIEPPFDCEKLLGCIQEAIAQDADFRRLQADRAAVLARVESLTARERQILEYVAAGEITKSIARLLEISPKTVEVHRSNIMKKMHVESAAGLLHLVAKYSLFPFVADVNFAERDRKVEETHRRASPRSGVSESRIAEVAGHKVPWAAAMSPLCKKPPQQSILSHDRNHPLTR